MRINSVKSGMFYGVRRYSRVIQLATIWLILRSTVAPLCDSRTPHFFLGAGQNALSHAQVWLFRYSANGRTMMLWNPQSDTLTCTLGELGFVVLERSRRCSQVVAEGMKGYRTHTLLAVLCQSCLFRTLPL